MDNLGKIFGIIMVGLLILSIPTGIIWFIGSHNPNTPAGYVGYLTQGAVFGKTQFYGLQTGPSSSGRTWMLHVVNVSITPYTYTEAFGGGTEVLAKDNLKIGFQVHILFKINPDKVKEFVEKYTTLEEKDTPENVVKTAYGNFLKEPLRTYARDEIQKHNSMDIKDSISDIGSAILDKVRVQARETPFDIMNIVVGNIQYPSVVADAVADALATTQIVERKKMEIHIMEQEKKKRIVEAEGIAEAMRIINMQLSVNYLQHEAIEAQKAMVGSPNHTTIYIPVGPMGVPLVGTVNTQKEQK